MSNVWKKLMDLWYWLDSIISFVLGVILVDISHGKLLNMTKLNYNLSASFFKVIRCMGLFVIVYSCYGVIIDYAIT